MRLSKKRRTLAQIARAAHFGGVATTSGSRPEYDLGIFYILSTRHTRRDSLREGSLLRAAIKPKDRRWTTGITTSMAASAALKRQARFQQYSFEKPKNTDICRLDVHPKLTQTTGGGLISYSFPRPPFLFSAAMRNTAMTICRLYKYVNLAEARRIFAWDSQRIFDILGFVKN